MGHPCVEQRKILVGAGSYLEEDFAAVEKPGDEPATGEEEKRVGERGPLVVRNVIEGEELKASFRSIREPSMVNFTLTEKMATNSERA